MRHGLAAALTGLLLAGCGTDTPPPDAAPSSPSATATTAPHSSPGSTASSPPTTSTAELVGRYEVVDVVDGDTITLSYQGGTSVRVIGIDTPETVHPSTPDECWGAQASAAAHRMLDGKRVGLVFDRSQGRTDKYGRLLGYLTVPKLGDYGLVMIRRGHAAEYTYNTPYRQQAPYRKAEARARSAGTGLWGRCGGTDTPLKTTTKQRSPAGNCEPGYDPCVPPYPPDVDCADVDGPIRVTGSDPHGLDGDDDGVACES
ncbi:MAG: hypothetical protein GEU83_12145 [Pseudonocardiaceae bacterium]|nr:hypothetical protein [Pseudonocardiaceae bacterium]